MVLQVRNRRFELSDEVPRHWHGGRCAISRLFDGLSVFFPRGERFFVRSVQYYRDRVTSPPLRQEVAAFCGQEGIHGREHERYNQLLAARGYPVEELEQRVDRILSRVERRLPRRLQLAVTCALEHYTAALGRMVLSDPRLLEGADPAMAALWRWHSAEENEHKAVAFDVFVAAGGTYLERVHAMLGVTVVFWCKVFQHQVRFMKRDGRLFSPSEWSSLLGFLFVKPGPLTALIPAVLDYLRPGFHPNDRDDRALLEEWKRLEESAEGTIR